MIRCPKTKWHAFWGLTSALETRGEGEGASWEENNQI